VKARPVQDSLLEVSLFEMSPLQLGVLEISLRGLRNVILDKRALSRIPSIPLVWLQAFAQGRDFCCREIGPLQISALEGRLCEVSSLELGPIKESSLQVSSLKSDSL
jgi:hypothetical protein